MGIMPSSTRSRDTEAPSGRGSLRVIWTARVTLAPFWAKMGNGSTLMLSMEAGSGLPSEKREVDYESRKLTAESILDLGRGSGEP